MQGAAARDGDPWLPDLCRLPRLATLFGVAELVVLVLLLAPGAASSGWTPGRFASASAFALWLSLTIAVLLCAARRPLSRLPVALGAAIAVAGSFAVALLGAAMVHQLDRSLGQGLVPPGVSLVPFATGSAAVAAPGTGALVVRDGHILLPAACGALLAEDYAYFVDGSDGSTSLDWLFTDGSDARQAELDTFGSFILPGDVPLGELGGFYSPHHRSYGAGALEAYAEMVRVSRDSGCPLHLAHATMNFEVNRGRAGELLDLLDRAVGDGEGQRLAVHHELRGDRRRARGVAAHRRLRGAVPDDPPPRLVQLRPVDIDAPLADFDRFARKTYDALDVIHRWVHRVAENHDFPTLRRVYIHELDVGDW